MIPKQQSEGDGGKEKLTFNMRQTSLREGQPSAATSWGMRRKTKTRKEKDSIGRQNKNTD